MMWSRNTLLLLDEFFAISNCERLTIFSNKSCHVM